MRVSPFSINIRYIINNEPQIAVSRLLKVDGDKPYSTRKDHLIQGAFMFSSKHVTAIFSLLVFDELGRLRGSACRLTHDLHGRIQLGDVLLVHFENMELQGF